jgi:hypothetical protein
MIGPETHELDEFDEFVSILRADDGRLLRRLASEGDAEAKLFIDLLRSHPMLRDLVVHYLVAPRHRGSFGSRVPLSSSPDLYGWICGRSLATARALKIRAARTHRWLGLAADLLAVPYLRQPPSFGRLVAENARR